MEFLYKQKRFDFIYNGKSFWEYTPKKTVIENENQLTQEYLLSDGLKVSNIAIKYPEFDAYEWVSWIENTGDSPTEIIKDLYDCDVLIPFEKDEPWKHTAFLSDKDSGMKIYSPSGSDWNKEEFYCDIDRISYTRYVNYISPGERKDYQNVGGRSSEVKAPFFNIHRQNRGVIFAIGWSGNWKCSIERNPENVNIKTGIGKVNFKLLPNEKIRTSSFVLMNYNCDFDESQNKWKRLIKKYFSPLGEDKANKSAPLCAGVWGGTPSEYHLKAIDFIKDNELPFEYLWMDAGWYGQSEQSCFDDFEGDWWNYSGDWRVNKNYHPNGLIDVSKAIKDAGLKFLLWFEPERAYYNTPMASEHPEYYLKLADNPEEFAHIEWAAEMNFLLNLGDENAWNYCFNTLSNLIENLHIDCYRQDFNIQPVRYWDMHDSTDRQGITEIKYIMGLYKLWDELRNKFPTLLIDNCASGGKRIDIELIRRSVPLWRSDAQCPANIEPELMQTQNMNYNTWLAFSGAGGGRIIGDTYKIRSCYAAALNLQYLWAKKDIEKISREEILWIKKYLNEYLRLRMYFSCDFYPLTKRLQSEDAWYASQYNRPEENDGIIQVFKPKKSSIVASLYKLRGLDKKAHYVIEDADNDLKYEYSGKTLMEKGFMVNIEEDRVAKIYFYRQKNDC